MTPPAPQSASAIATGMVAAPGMGAARERSASPSAPLAPAGAARPGGGAERILLVDDHPRNLQMLLQFLAPRGYGLLVAKSGEAAIEIAVKSRPAVVLLDVMMPGIDGFETCRRLKANPITRDAAVIFLSAAGETQQKLSGFAAGGVDYVTKPIQGEEVVARVETHLTIRRLNLALQAKIGEIERELAVVQEMQRRLLPPALPDMVTLDLCAHYATSRYAGGDYYDVAALSDGRWGILVADVSGHGTPAAVTMAMTRTLFHARPELRNRPGETLRSINDHFGYLWEEMGFMTALYGVYDPPRRSLRLACAGHCRPLVRRQVSGRVEEVECAATIPLLIGPLDDLPETEVALHPGDHALFYTDGIIERTNNAGDFCGVERLAEWLGACGADAAAEATTRLVANLDAFAGGREPADDQTLLVGVVR